MWWLLPIATAQQAVVNPFEEADEGELFRFEEQLVTVASRYAQTVRKAPSIVTLVTADEIRERQYRTVSEVLRTLPGFYVWKSEEGRDLAAIRGVISSDNNKLLVLVDGVPWYEGVYTHGFIDEYLPVSNIRQIEVIKGPGSAIYGTNAFTGVVNIVTFQAADLDGARVRLMGGSTTRGDVTATAGGRTTVGTVPTSASGYVRVFGQTGRGLELNPELEVGITGTDPRKAVNAGVELGVGDLALQLHSVDYAHTYLFNPTDGPFEAMGKDLDTFDLQYHALFADARYHLDLGESTFTPFAWYQRHDNPGAYFFGGGITVDPATLEASQFFYTVDAEKRTERLGAGLDAEVRPALDHVVVGGAGVEAIRVQRLFDLGFPSGGPPEIANQFAVLDGCGQPVGRYTNPLTEGCTTPGLRNLYGYAQYTWTTTAFLELTAGARVDSRSVSGTPTDVAYPRRTAVSPRLGVLLVPGAAVTTKLLYGHAFRAPSVRELLVTVAPDPATGVYDFASGNPKLTPETIDTAEAEVTVAPSEGLSLRADGSFSTLSSEIDKVAPGFYCNLPGHLQVWGGELGLRVEEGPIGLGADYAMTLAEYGGTADPDADPQNNPCDRLRENPFAERQQYEFPPHMGKAHLRLAVSNVLSLTAFGEVYSRRPRAVWSPEAHNPDGEPVALLHLAGRAAGLGPDGRVEVGFGVRNVLGSRWNTGVYRDDSDEDDKPAPAMGEGRAVSVSVEARL